MKTKLLLSFLLMILIISGCKNEPKQEQAKYAGMAMAVNANGGIKTGIIGTVDYSYPDYPIQYQCPEFTLPTIDNVADGDIVGIPIIVKGFQHIGSVTLNIEFNNLTWAYVGGIERNVMKSNEPLTFNSDIVCTGINIGVVPTTEPDISRLVLGMYSLPAVSLPDGEFVTMFFKYTNKFANYTKLKFMYPEDITISPMVLVTDALCNTIPPAPCVLDGSGNVICDSVATPYVDRVTGEDKICWTMVPRRGEVDHGKYFVNGRIGPLIEKPVFAQENTTLTGYVVYGTGAKKLPNIKVTAMNLNSRQTYTTTTNANGQYAFTIPKGIYYAQVSGCAPGLIWQRGDNADLTLLTQYVEKTIAIPDALRWMVNESCFGGLSFFDQGGSVKDLLLNRNNCNTSRGYLGWWDAPCIDPKDLPRPWDEYIEGKVNYQGHYFGNTPNAGDGFRGQKTWVLVDKPTGLNLGLVAISDLNGDQYGTAIPVKTFCNYMVPKTAGKKGAKVTTYTQCKNASMKDGVRCSTHKNK